ncbi:MAG: hypothetical protein HY231_18085 [Acidobacteria bacterium]|nr:hypothetical protein [Acidobacteriota bacterium]
MQASEKISPTRISPADRFAKSGCQWFGQIMGFAKWQTLVIVICRQSQQALARRIFSDEFSW